MTIFGDNYGEYDTETGEYRSDVLRDERNRDAHKRELEEATKDL